MSSCILKEHFKSTSLSNVETVPLFIGMPRSKVVFEHIAPKLYQAFCDYFRQVGYHLVGELRQGYRLEIEIKSLSPIENFVSPDVLLFHATIKLELECRLVNFAGVLVDEKSFSFSTLVSKPRSPILSSAFFTYELERLLRRSLHKVERHFRKHLLV